MAISLDSKNDFAFVRARALASAGRMAWFQADFATARVHLQESLVLFQDAGDLVGTLEAMSGLVLVLTRQGEMVEALSLLRKAIPLLQSVSDSQKRLPILAGLGRAAAFMASEKSLPIARDWSEEAARLAREVSDKRSLAWSLDSLAICHYYGGELKVARAQLEEGILLFEELGDLWGVSLEKWLLGNVARREGSWEEARALNSQSLTVQSRGNSRQGLPYMLDSFAFLAIEERQPQRAVRLMAASQALREHLSLAMQPLYRVEHDKYTSVLRTLLSTTQWDALWDEGYALPFEAVISLSLSTISLEQ